MIQSFVDLRRFMDSDRKSRGGGNAMKLFVFDPIFRFGIALRINEYLLNTGCWRIVRAIPLLHFRRLSIRLGFSVPFNVFDEGLAIVHYGLLVVSPFARIGKNCRVHAGVNIGGAGGFLPIEEARNAAPCIGDNCYIGPGAKIYGPVRIANDCVVGANAVVNKSFDVECSTIAGVPAKVISNEGSEGMLIRGADAALDKSLQQ